MIRCLARMIAPPKKHRKKESVKLTFSNFLRLSPVSNHLYAVGVQKVVKAA